MAASRVEKYIEIVEHGTSASGMTLVWRVRNKRSGADVGLIKWYGGFRKYVFYPTIEDVDWVLFDADCMRLIADFCDAQMGARKNATIEMYGQEEIKTR